MSSKSLILISLLLLILTIGTAAAANQTDVDDLTANDEVISVPEENENLESNEVDFEGTTFTELNANVSACSNGDVINLKSDITQDGESQINITKPITINGNGHTIDANGKSKIFCIKYAKNVVLNNITFIGASDKAIDINSGSATVSNCRFINCTASSGAGIYVMWGNLNVSCCEFVNNNVTYNGPAIWNTQGTLSVTDCKFRDNKAGSAGGAVFVQQASGSFSGCEFTGNNGSNGGAIDFIRSNATILNCSFNKNNAEKGDGIVYLSDSNVSVSGCNFTDNTAGKYGGAIYMYTSDATVCECNFAGNSAKYGGGAIATYETVNNASFTNCQFKENSAMQGGAFYWISGNLTVTCSTFLGNKANKYSNIYNKTAASLDGNDYYAELAISASDMTWGNANSFKFTATFADKNGRPVVGETLTFSVNGKNYTAVTDENGTATVSLKLAAGTYKVNVTSDHKLYSAGANLKIVQRLVSANVNMFYNDGSKLKVRAFNNDGSVASGKTVAIKLAGKTYKVKTDKNGYAYLKITAQLKKNTKAVKYAATITYNGYSIKKTVVIKPILKYKAQTLKKSKKTNKIKVSLKKALKGKKIVLKIKGKKIAAKTNKKGVATFKIPKKVMKKLKAGKKYKIVFTYGKSTLTKKVKVKK